MVVSSSNKEETQATYDRKAELKAFDETKAGVKGLIDSGAAKVPRIFIHPPENLDKINLQDTPTDTELKFPIIDLDGIDTDPVKRGKIVDQIRDASETWGFFQVVNHGIPMSCLEEMMNGVRRFNEQDRDIKKQYYSRDFSKPMGYNSNFDLYSSAAASWRDSFYCVMAPNPPQPEAIPDTCRSVYRVDYAALSHQKLHCDPSSGFTYIFSKPYL